MRSSSERAAIGRVIGIAYVGYKAELPVLSQSLEQSRVLASGFVAVIDSNTVRYLPSWVTKEQVQQDIDNMAAVQRGITRVVTSGTFDAAADAWCCVVDVALGLPVPLLSMMPAFTSPSVAAAATTTSATRTTRTRSDRAGPERTGPGAR